ncbi:MAG: hypothetical protein AAGA91_18950, partial [Pseudomonadota bacterium]
NIRTAQDTNARSFINSSRGVNVTDGGRLELSKIYLWYLNDYGGSLGTIKDHLLLYANDDTHELIGEHPGSVRYRYDWSLNDAKTAHTD